MPQNKAAWLTRKHAPLEVRDAPYIEPKAGEVLVRNHAVAINPVDWAIQYMGSLLFNWIRYPFVLGSDLAGEVVAVGEGVTAIKVGDRVLAMAAGGVKQRNRASEGAFQAYTIVLEKLTTVIPDGLSYAEASAIPLGLTTAACGLFQDDLLGLTLPSATPTARDEWVIVTGGATSVGGNAIQLAVAAGYSVVTTCSAKNFDYVKSLGAALAFDYRDKTLAGDMAAALRGKTVVGALAIGAGSTNDCLEALGQCGGRKFVASCSSPLPFETFVKGSRVTLPILLSAAWALMRARRRTQAISRRTGARETFFDASSLVDNDVGRYIYRDYLGPALASGAFRPSPPPRVVGTSLADIQQAFDIQRAGVSATKIVVTLD